MTLSDSDIAIRILAIAESEPETDLEQIKGWIAYYDKHFDVRARSDHIATCDGVVWECDRCMADDALKRAAVFRELFGIEPA